MDELKSVPYIVLEASEAKHERTVKRLVIALIISILVSLATNLAWLWFFNQYDYVDEEESHTRTFIQDGEGLNIIGDSNGVSYESDSSLQGDGQTED